MRNNKIKIFSFKDLSTDSKEKVLLEIINEKKDMINLIKTIVHDKFKDKSFVSTSLNIEMKPLIIKGYFYKGFEEYYVDKENDVTKFYSNKNLASKTHLISLRDQKDEFIQTYLNIYSVVNELTTLIINSLEDYYYELLLKDKHKVYLRNGYNLRKHLKGD